MNDELISPNFWLSEFLQSDTATRLSLPNSPDGPALAALRTITIPGVQSIRDCLGMPMFVSSGYRSPIVNRAVGGSANSQHVLGLAADLKSPQFGSPLTMARYLLQHWTHPFEQMIQEGSWLHIGFPSAGQKGKREVLTAHFVPGCSVTYSPGLS
jgi:hypothetical protein